MYVHDMLLMLIYYYLCKLDMYVHVLLHVIVRYTVHMGVFIHTI